jgi:hypothetical protein
VFHDCNEEPNAVDDKDEGSGYYFLKTPPELFPAIASSLKPPQPSKALRDAYHESYLQRPLPELPVTEPTRTSRRCSVASAVSATLSITPSLLQYVEEGSFNTEEFEVGVAQLVQLPLSGSALDVAPDKETAADSSSSDYETSPKSPGDSSLAQKLSPRRYLPTTGSGLERGIAMFTSPKQSFLSIGLKSRQSLPRNFHSPRDRPLFQRTNLSEPEGACESPSPGRRRAATSAVRRDFSPQAARDAGRSLFAGLRKMKLNGSPSKLSGMVLGRDMPKPSDGGNIVRRAMGSWI